MNFRTELKKIWKPTHGKLKWLRWGMHLSLIPAVIFGTWPLWLSAIIMFWFVHGLGSGIGVHRYFTHRAFQTNRFWEIVMSFFFTIACTGSTIGYVLMHRKHHENSDTDKDPHNPSENGIWKTWIGLYNLNNLRLNPKMFAMLMKNPVMKFFHNYYFLILLSYAIILFLINPIYVIFFLFIPAIGQFHTNSALIVLAHMPSIGYRNFDTNDNSRNIWWLKPFMLGEELHNNHHKRPSAVTMRSENTWREFDPLYYVIKYAIATELVE